MPLQRLQGVARLVTVVAAAVAAAVALWTAVSAGQFVPAVAVMLALLARVQGPSPSWRRAGSVGLVAAVAAVVGVSGGPTDPVFVALLLVMGDLALTMRQRTIVLVGVGAAATCVLAAWVLGSGSVQASWIWPLLLVPMVGIVITRLVAEQPLEGTAALESATLALEEVVRLAEHMPAGFDRWSVARAVRAELLEASRVVDGAQHTPQLLVGANGVLFGVGATWSRRPVGLVEDFPGQRRGRLWAAVDGSELPAPVSQELGDGRWLVHRLAGTGGHVVLVPQDVQGAALDAVEEVLRPAAVALANVERFERLQEIATNAARVRVAHDLHDGVAQSLTHVRFELDLLGLEHAELSQDVGRIRAVADAALSEVRRTVDELREAVPLPERLQRHVELLASFVPATIELDVPPDLDLDLDAADDVFRVVQEALSNAVHHAGAGTIRVHVTLEDETLSVVVVDDGAGIEAGVPHGVGLGGMHIRAERVGGTVTVRERRGGGTVVELEVPLTTPLDSSPAAPPSPTVVAGER